MEVIEVYHLMSDNIQSSENCFISEGFWENIAEINAINR